MEGNGDAWEAAETNGDGQGMSEGAARTRVMAVQGMGGK